MCSPCRWRSRTVSVWVLEINPKLWGFAFPYFEIMIKIASFLPANPSSSLLSFKFITSYFISCYMDMDMHIYIHIPKYNCSVCRMLAIRLFWGLWRNSLAFANKWCALA